MSHEAHQMPVEPDGQPQEINVTVDGLKRAAEEAHRQVISETPARRTMVIDASGNILTASESARIREEGMPESTYKHGQR